MSADVEYCMYDIDCHKCGRVIFSEERHIVTRGFGRWDYCLKCYDIKNTNHTYFPNPKFIPDWIETETCKYKPDFVLA